MVALKLSLEHIAFVKLQVGVFISGLSFHLQKQPKAIAKASWRLHLQLIENTESEAIGLPIFSLRVYHGPITGKVDLDRGYWGHTQVGPVLEWDLAGIAHELVFDLVNDYKVKSVFASLGTS